MNIYLLLFKADWEAINMRNLTEDVVLRGHEADSFMENMLHPNKRCIELREEFIHSGNFRSEEKDGTRYIYDDGLDLSFLDTLDDSKDESSVTQEDQVMYSTGETKQIYIEYTCEDYNIKFEKEFVGAVEKLQEYNFSVDIQHSLNMIDGSEEKYSLQIKKEEDKYNEKMLDVRNAA